MFLAVALFAIALYAVTLGGTFVYDDVAVVLQDRRLANPRDWIQYWTDSYNFGVDNLYRPLVSMTYAVAHWLHPDTAWPYHAFNVLQHALVSVMVAWVALRLTEKPLVAIVSGLLFAAHPVHVEAVANIVGRAEMMCAIATLGAIGLAIRPLTTRRVIAIWLCCAVAILCKEQGLLAPLMVGVVSRNRFDERASARGGLTTDDEDTRVLKHARQRSLGAVLFALLLANVAAIVFIRENVIHLKFWWERKFLDPWIQPLSDSVGVDRWLAPFTIAGRYLGLLVAPVTLRIDYGGPIVPGVAEPRDPFFWLGLVAVLLWLMIICVGWWRRDRLLLVVALLFAIAYAPVSNWPTIIGVNVAERLMYLPSAFFVILIAALLARLPRRAMIGAVTIVLVLFSLRTVTYAWRWNDRLAFYEYSAAVEPRSMKATLLALEECAGCGDLDAAERWARAAIAIDPKYDDAWLRLAGVLIDKGDFDGAQAAIDRARSIQMTTRVGTYEKRLAEKRAQAR
jgi:protein O-mannosyl-transferase